MRKSLFLTLVLSLCVANFGAFAATRTNTRSSSATTAARVATRQNVVRAATVPTTPTKAVTSRAATQKALNMGTKVATATANTAVNEACQNAYYGCMDAFCMLDNAAGGRCQCSDRVVELNAVLDEILLLDEQSMRIATEGVEQVQMGEYAGQISDRAKSIEEGISGSRSSAQTSSPLLPNGVLDLSAWSNADIFDNAVEEEPVFAAVSNNDIEGKTGDSLQNAAAKICVAQIPAECKSSSALLQMAYVQKIKSDCIGYENALKQQKSASQQKLLTAQKAVRDAVLTEVREQNKYETVGDCAVAFARCMQTTAECKSDYTGCVTLAAAENVRNNKAGSKAKQTTIKGVVSGADITLAATTMEQLLAKKEICAGVTRQCVNVNRNDEVWNVFLRNAAPALKSAELIAEQNLRSNCIPSVAECFKTACRAQFLDNEESYDMCLSNPQAYKSLCKVQLEPCLEATGGTYDKPENSSLWNGLMALLNSMKVDTCTEEVKTCLTERCGKDFSGCVGLSTYTIGNLCPTDKLTACMTATNSKDGTPYYKNEDAIREYVAEIAQGLALQIDNSLAEVCQNAANNAMIRICGDTENCDGIKLDLSGLESLMKVQACKWDDATGESLTCFPDLSQFSDDDIYTFKYDSDDENAKLMRIDGSGYGVYATLLNKPDISSIVFGENDGLAKFSARNTSAVNDFSQQSTDAAVAVLQGVLDRAVEQIDSDPTVVYCKTGREVQGFRADEKIGRRGADSARFPELTEKYKYVIADGLLSKLSEQTLALEEDFEADIAALNNKITERVTKIAKQRGEVIENVLDKRNLAVCDSYRHTRVGYAAAKLSMVRVDAVYDGETNVCTLTSVRYLCYDTFANHTRCEDKGWDEGTLIGTQKIPLQKFQ